MMNKVHPKKYFLDWLERKLNSQQLDRIDRHLGGCSECQNYFEKMKQLLADPEPPVLPDLEPDYFLPTRIKELAKAGEGKQSLVGLWKARLRTAMGTAMIIFALLIGIFLGKWMSHTQNFSETEIILSYASMFSDDGIGEVWDNVITENNGEQQ